MTIVKWAIAVVLIFLILLIIAAYGRTKYEEGFGIGALCTFYWVESNTNCKDAAQNYILITQLHPEDGIYICLRTADGKFRIPDKPKMLRLDKI